MVILSGYGTMPHQRQNRRRERPGSRKRHTTRRSHIQSGAQTDFEEAILDAHDSSVPLPSDRSKPSPLLRQNFDQSWQRWKARQAEEKAIAEMDRMQLEQEQIKLFGGDVDDDELYRMGILYKDEGTALKEFNSITPDIPVQQSAPMFVIRPSRLRKRTQCSSWRTLPLYLSLSDLSTDADIARFLSPSTSYTSTIQERDSHTTDIPQSLPPTSALGSTHFLDNMSLSHLDFNSGDWTFISAAPHTPLVSSPSSEPETWILLSDDS